VCVATIVDRMDSWSAEIIDENNFHRNSLRLPDGSVDHRSLQNLRKADVVGFYGGLTSTIPRLYSIAKICKEMGIVTIAGGQHFNDETLQEALNSGIDVVVLGEGEVTISELLAAFDSGKPLEEVKGIAFLQDGKIVNTGYRDPIVDFSPFPLPDFSLVHHAKINLYPVERIRGCGMECEFCTVKGRPRPSPPERLMNQISRLVETRKARKFFIVDDLFGQQREETLRFCHMLADYKERLGIKLDFTAQIRLDKGRDSELLTAMRNAGINTVAIGFESPIREDLETMNKHLRQQEMISLVKAYRKHGFFIHGMFIFGYPSLEKPQGKDEIPMKERIKAFREFIRKARLDTIQILLPVPLPGTELRKRLLDSDRVYDNSVVGWEYYDGNFPLFEPDPPFSPVQLQSASQKITGGFYRFKNIFWIILNIFSFSSMIFFLHDIKLGWKLWYRRWRNSVLRFGGWITFKNWTSDFKRNVFSDKINYARASLGSRGKSPRAGKQMSSMIDSVK